MAARRAGIEPVWASEIDPFPIRVTKKNFPKMKHLGDISRIDGGEIDQVDIITFGSPCQNLSNMGDRKGLSGDRSSLFHQAIRVIREMREKTNGRYPRFAVWENVPAALSSNGGSDFGTVLREFVLVKDQTLHVPESQRWEQSGVIEGDGFSIAWRVLNAKFWGVPQNRNRIFVVADFGGQCAGEILFDGGEMQKQYQVDAETIPDSSIRTDGNTSTTSGNKLIYTMSHSSHFTLAMTNIVPTLCASDGCDPNWVTDNGRVRRMTPTEYCRSQGFPDDWCADLELSEAQESDISEWKAIWDVWQSINSKNPRNEKWVRAWLESPAKNGDQYKMWGNGVALPCVQFIMDGIVKYS